MVGKMWRLDAPVGRMATASTQGPVLLSSYSSLPFCNIINDYSWECVYVCVGWSGVFLSTILPGLEKYQWQ